MSAASRQRVRRALARLGLTPHQAESVRRLLRDERRHWDAVRQRLAECRCDLEAALADAAPDSLAVLELTLEERLLQQRARALSAHLESQVARILRPEQAARLRALAPAALGDVLARICA